MTNYKRNSFERPEKKDKYPINCMTRHLSNDCQNTGRIPHPKNTTERGRGGRGHTKKTLKKKIQGNIDIS